MYFIYTKGKSNCIKSVVSKNELHLISTAHRSLELYQNRYFICTKGKSDCLKSVDSTGELYLISTAQQALKQYHNRYFICTKGKSNCIKSVDSTSELYLIFNSPSSFETVPQQVLCTKGKTNWHKISWLNKWALSHFQQPIKLWNCTTTGTLHKRQNQLT